MLRQRFRSIYWRTLEKLARSKKYSNSKSTELCWTISKISGVLHGTQLNRETKGMAMSLPGFEVSRITVNGLNYLNFRLSHSSYYENKLLLPLLIF